MGNSNLKVKGFDLLIFCKKKLRQNVLDRGSNTNTIGILVLGIEMQQESQRSSYLISYLFTLFIRRYFNKPQTVS